MAPHNSIEVRPYAAALGAEILGVDLAEPLDDRSWDIIRDAFHKYLVIFFWNQRLTPEQLVQFSKRFGELEPYPYVHGIEGYPELIDIVKMPDEIQNFGRRLACRHVFPGGAAAWRRALRHRGASGGWRHDAREHVSCL